VKTLVVALALVTSAYAGVDVGIDTILSPSGTIDSGQSVIPRCVVANYSSVPAESVCVHFTIDDGTPSGYSDTLWLPALAPSQHETLAFGAWVPHGRDSMVATAWTVCVGDTYPQNDTFRQRFLVRVFDIAITQILMPPPDTVFDSGVVFYPSCRLWDYGNGGQDTCIVGFSIGMYYSACTLTLRPWPHVVVAPDSYVTQPGIWECSVTATVRGDLHPENNTRVDTFSVRGSICADVDARAILSPPSVIDTTMTITPRGRYGNKGVAAASFEAYFLVFNAAGSQVYADSTPVLIGSGDSIDLDFSNVRFTTPGYYTAACSVYMAGDQNSTNDVKRRRFRVVEFLSGDIGIVEIIPPPPDSTFQPTAVWKNYSDHRMEYAAFCFVYNKYGARVYSDYIPGNTLEGGEQHTLSFASINPGGDTGWAMCCSTAAGGDTNPVNDTMWYPHRPGIEEGQPQATSRKVHATAMRRLPPGAVAFDATGRRVLNPKSGVCFLAEGPGARGQGPGKVRKVILER
jgi:hypothetical protein